MRPPSDQPRSLEPVCEHGDSAGRECQTVAQFPLSERSGRFEVLKRMQVGLADPGAAQGFIMRGGR
jgi:hypothetical protein